MELAGKKVLVFGSGISGISAANLLLIKGSQVIIYDGTTTKTALEIQKQVEGGQVQVIIGELEDSVLETLDCVVLSPGVPTDLPIVTRMKECEIPIWGEIELAYVNGYGNVLAITGTNGKTTTTALLGEIMKAHNPDTYVVGNIGIPYTEEVLKTTDNSIVVAEVSSFQLETIESFTPKVSAILNVTPDHLNRHHTMEAYIEAKEKIAQNQTGEHVCVLNYEDEVTREFGENLETEVLYFSSRRTLDKGMYLEADEIKYRNQAVEEILCHVNQLQVLGLHNYENVMAASLMALAYGVKIELIREVVCKFGGVEHRIEFVCEKNRVVYYNDSKGTNPDAAIKGIQAMNRPTILIGGGYDKDSSYSEWIEAFDGKVKMLVLTGQTRYKIAEEAKACGFEHVMLTETFDEAVLASVKLAEPGDAVLLSPACASWGAFNNYEERGDKFKELINNL